MSLIVVLRTFPKVQVAMSLKELAPNSITSTVRVDMATLEDKRLKVFVNVCDHTSFVLFHLLEFQILGQVNDGGTLKAERTEKIGLHLLFVNSYEQVWIINIPKHLVC